MRGIAGGVTLGLALGAGWVGIGACSGEDPVPRKDPEVCDDGVDNDDDGLVDCDDTEECGGLACRDTDVGDDDDTEPPPTVEILFDETACCDFDYASSDCPQKEVGTFSVVNRSETQEALLDVFCDRVGPDAAPVIQWKPEGPTEPRPTVANAPIAPGNSVDMVSVFVCAAGVSQTFTVECTIFVETEDGSAEDEHVFALTATTLGI